MATNREMLAEAIAEAKSVKDMAIQNAKSALEESFTPRLKEMLSAKLQEMEDEEESTNEGAYKEMEDDSMKEAYSDNDPKGPTAHGNVEEGDNEEETMEEELNLDELLAELEEEEGNEDELMNEEESEEESEEDGESIDLEDMEEEDLIKMIEDVIADMVESGELEAGEGAEMDDEESEEGEEMEMSDEEEEIALDELLKEIEEEEITEEKEDLEEISLGITDTEAIISMIAPAIAVATGFGINVIKNKLKNAKSAKELKAKAEEIAKAGEKKSELQEAYSTIETLREEISDINLLNAKLLYTNKIFKAKNLNESQKVKVLSSFDRAATVDETKLVYETLSEGLKSKESIKEQRGSASKSTIIPQSKQPIVEDAAFARMQKLAFHESKH